MAVFAIRYSIIVKNIITIHSRVYASVWFMFDAIKLNIRERLSIFYQIFFYINRSLKILFERRTFFFCRRWVAECVHNNLNQFNLNCLFFPSIYRLHWEEREHNEQPKLCGTNCIKNTFATWHLKIIKYKYKMQKI